MTRRITSAVKMVILSLFVTIPAWAQSSTATIRGTVTNESGNRLSNAEINAVGTQTGFVRTVRSNADGSYQIAGLIPGEYNIIVAATAYEPRTETVTVRVGQSVDLNLKLSPTSVVSESITVLGNALVETRSAEAATNVTTQQIENLPQNERNFLNFAALAPGIRTSNDPQRKVIASDAQNAEQTNVFIDGVSFKNDILQGGVAGQDSSRGNPFPQNAVQEFRVITQNYSAQYEKASSAIITAVTKSGGNQFKGEAFTFYQPKNWVSKSPSNFQFNTLTTNESYRRYQGGLSFGGPIAKDVLDYFVSYEGDQEHATTPVTIGNPTYLNQFGSFTGVFPSPFRENLGFGKLSWQPFKNQLVDVSGTYRKEHELRDFGGQTSFQSATDLRNSVYGSTIRHQWNNNSALNQASLTWQKYAFNPTPLTPGLIGQNFEGVIRVGGNSTLQKFQQRRLELRDDYNFGNFNWMGAHALQIGGNADALKYDVVKEQNGNPLFSYRNDTANGFTFAQPYQVQYGFGNPNISAKNREYGIYGQDTWTVNPKFTLNLGLRYDYESNGIDDKYVTPANIVAGLAGKVDPSYFSTGSNRHQFKGEIQPRLGFAYDLLGDNHTVLFGGAGRYYDRLFFNGTLDERFRLQYPTYNIQFSPDGRPGTIQFDPKYLTTAGLDALIGGNGIPADRRPRPEIFLVNNGTKPPYSNQFNLGIRQALGTWMGSASYNAVRGYRGLTFVSASGLCCAALVPGFGNVILSDREGKRFWYNALFLTLDRPYSNASGFAWGAHVAWTHSRAQQTGNDLFSLDFPSAAEYGKHDVPGSERDRIVATGTVGLPWDIRFSSILSFGSGGATNLLDFSQGFSLTNRQATHPFLNSIYPKKTGGFADRSVDFAAEKAFNTFGKSSISLRAEVFNAFNFHNFGCLTNFIPPEGNPNIGKPNCVINLGRREQVGVRLKF